MSFKPDYGIYLLEKGWEKETTHHFYAVPIDHIQFIGKDLFSFMVNLVIDEQEYAVSFDFDEYMLLQIFDIAPKMTQEEMREFFVRKPVPPCTLELQKSFSIIVEATLGEIQTVKAESFVPFVIQKVQDTKNSSDSVNQSNPDFHNSNKRTDAFNFADEDFYAVDLAIKLARLLLTSPTLMSNQIITLGKAMEALENLPETTPSIFVEFGISVRQGDDLFSGMRFWNVLISEESLYLSDGGSVYDHRVGSDTLPAKSYEISIGKSSHSDLNFYEWWEGIQDVWNLNPKIYIEDLNENKKSTSP